MEDEVMSIHSGSDVSPCRRLTQLARDGDASGLSTVLRTLQKRYGKDVVAQEIQTCDFGDRNAKSALHCAAMRGRATILRLLLEAASDPNAMDDPGNTPLHYAAEQGHAGAVYVLLAAGARPDAANNFGTTPRQNAEANSWDTPRILEGKVMVRRMFAEGHTVYNFEDLPLEETPVLSAATPQQRNSVGTGPFQGRPVPAEPDKQVPTATNNVMRTSIVSDVSTMCTVQDLDVDTGHHLSTAELVRRGHLEALKARIGEALARGGRDAAIAEVTDHEEDGQDSRIVFSAIHCAAAKGDVQALRILLSTRANPNVANDAGDTPLHVACRMGQAEAVQELLNLGADPKVMNNFGKGPAEHAEPQSWDGPELRRQKALCRKSVSVIELDSALPAAVRSG